MFKSTTLSENFIYEDEVGQTGKPPRAKRIVKKFKKFKKFFFGPPKGMDGVLIGALKAANFREHPPSCRLCTHKG